MHYRTVHFLQKLHGVVQRKASSIYQRKTTRKIQWLIEVNGRSRKMPIRLKVFVGGES